MPASEPLSTSQNELVTQKL